MAKTKLTRRLLLSALTAFTAAGSALASFQQPLTSPQASALGNSALAAIGDSSSLFTNPAGLAGLEHKDLYFMYNQMYAGAKGMAGMNDGFMTAAVPSKLGTFAIGVANFRADNLKIERTISVGWAKSSGRLSYGLSGKYLYHNYLVQDDPTAPNDPVFQNGHAKGAFGLDFGAVYRASSRLSFGAAVRNANSPDVGIATTDRVPREYQAAAAYDFPRFGLRVLSDVVYRDQDWGTTQDKVIPGVGLEKWVSNGRAAFRLGVNSLGASAGVGLELGRLGFDYTFSIKKNIADAGYGTHMIGIRLRFGQGGNRDNRVRRFAGTQPAALTTHNDIGASR